MCPQRDEGSSGPSCRLAASAVGERESHRGLDRHVHVPVSRTHGWELIWGKGLCKCESGCRDGLLLDYPGVPESNDKGLGKRQRLG